MSKKANYIALLARASEHPHDAVPEDIVDAIISIQERLQEVDIQRLRQKVLRNLDEVDLEQLELFLEIIDQTTAEMEASIDEELDAIGDDLQDYLDE